MLTDAMDGATELSGEVELHLRRAYATARRATDAHARVRELRDGDEAYLLSGAFDDDAILFDGEALEHHAAIVSSLTRSALAHGGFKADAVSAHIATACRQPSADEAVIHLREVLAQPATTYTIGEPLRMPYDSDEPGRVGRCLVHRSLADSAPRDPRGPLDDWHGKQFPARVITSTVTAHDPQSAYLRAVDAIDEAKAILHLASWDREDSRRTSTVTLDDGRIASIGSGGEGFGHYWSAYMILYPPYTHISEAAAKDPARRNELERRVVAATRWHYLSATNTWPSAALTSLMTALEALLLPIESKRARSSKGDKLATRLHLLGAAPWAPRDEKFKDWFISLYKHRNDATHQGTNFEEDLAVTHLRTITKLAIRWAADHLDRLHPGAHGRACITLDEALDEALGDRGRPEAAV